MLGVDEVIGINSTGSLKKELKPGAIVIPDDYILLDGGPTIFDSSDPKPVHITPVLHDGVRQNAIEAARLSGIDVVDGGIYWQTKGPRLETRAEIALMSRFADIVGMTMAGEAVIAQELEIPYASICSVDNFAHGIGGQKLTLEGIIEHARRNRETIIQIILKYLEGRTQ
jgi:5'-methylthioadenosine phosphorylase